MNLWLPICVVCAICGNHEGFHQKEREEESGNSQAKTLAVPPGVDCSHVKTAQANQTAFDAAPLQGPFHHPIHRHHGDQSAMEMPSLQKTQQVNHGLLRHVWVLLGSMLGQGLCTWRTTILLTEGLETMELGHRLEQFPEATESEEKSIEPTTDQGRQRWWENKTEDCCYTTTQMASPCIRLLQDPRQHVNGATSRQNHHCAQSSRIHSRGSRPDRYTTVHIPGWVATGFAGQSRQDQEDLTDGFEAAHRPIDESEEGIGCTPGSSLQAQGCLETSCREARSEHEGTIATVPEGHAGLRCLRGRPDAAVPKRQSCNPTDHPTEQTCRRRPTSLERCGFRTPSRYINSSHRNRRPGERRSRSGDDGGGKSTRDSVYLVRMCGIAYTRKGTIQVSWTTDRHGSWQQAKFMRRRCGMTPTQQSVYTERDRPRNLRFSTCVGFLESSYVGTAASDLPSHQNTYGWMILEEPKLPAGTNPRRCMDTETACRHSLVHSIRQAHDFTNTWEAIGKAFLLHLDVSSTFSTPFHLDHDAVWDFNTGLDDSIPCRNRPNEQTQSSEPSGFAHGPAPAEGTSMRLEVDQLRRRPLPYAFAAAENHAAQDTIVEEHIGEKIVIVSYGFKHYYLEQRTLHVDFTQRASWRQLLRAQWADHDDGLFFALHSVKPPSVIHRSTVAVVVQLSPLPEVQALCLLQFVPHQGLPEPAFVTPVPVRAMRSTVFQACGQHLTAESSAVIKQGHKLWPRGEVQIIGHGTFLRILIDVESDETTMSQLGL